MANTTRAPFFDCFLKPHRAMKPEHISKMLIGLAVVFFLASIRMYFIGAWPVAVFLIADIAALAIAFWINFRRARQSEHITLTETKLTVKRTSANGQIESWVFEPYWVKLSMEKHGKHDLACALSLHGQRVTLGRFLTDNQRKGLYRDLRHALAKWKNK